MSLSVQKIAKEYPTPAEPLRVLSDISFDLNEGETLAIVGPSGSGKSTLLAILGALEPPTSGAVRLAGVDPFALDEPRLAEFRNRQIGFVFQDHYLLPQCTVLENVLTPLLAGGRATDEDARRARGLLERVGLAERIAHRPAELSGGERQRAAIARALICGPKLLLADEPTGNLDRRSAQTVADLLLELSRERGTMLAVATHSDTLAEALGRQLRLEDGRGVVA